MLKIHCSRSSLILLSMALVFILGSCAPTKYLKPVENFNETVDGSKQIYFQQLESSHEAYVQKKKMRFNLFLLLDDNFYGSPLYKKHKKELLELSKAENLPIESLKLRKRAFDILGYYGKTLKTLASDEKTDSLKAELTGLSGDTVKLLETVIKTSEVSDSFIFLEKVSEWTGPINNAVGVINKIVDIVADYYREQALKEAITTSHGMVVELLAMLSKEAVSAADMRSLEYSNGSTECQGILEQRKNGNPEEFLKKVYLSGSCQTCDENKKCDECLMAFSDFLNKKTLRKYSAYQICEEFDRARVKGIASDEIKKAFTMVVEAHAAMKKMAEGGSFEEMLRKVQEFQQKLEDMKTKFEIVIS